MPWKEVVSWYCHQHQQELTSVEDLSNMEKLVNQVRVLHVLWPLCHVQARLNERFFMPHRVSVIGSRRYGAAMPHVK